MMRKSMMMLVIGCSLLRGGPLGADSEVVWNGTWSDHVRGYGLWVEFDAIATDFTFLKAYSDADAKAPRARFRERWQKYNVPWKIHVLLHIARFHGSGSEPAEVRQYLIEPSPDSSPVVKAWAQIYRKNRTRGHWLHSWELSIAPLKRWGRFPIQARTRIAVSDHVGGARVHLEPFGRRAADPPPEADDAIPGDTRDAAWDRRADRWLRKTWDGGAPVYSRGTSKDRYEVWAALLVVEPQREESTESTFVQILIEETVGELGKAVAGVPGKVVAKTAIKTLKKKMKKKDIFFMDLDRFTRPRRRTVRSEKEIPLIQASSSLPVDFSRVLPSQNPREADDQLYVEGEKEYLMESLLISHRYMGDIKGTVRAGLYLDVKRQPNTYIRFTPDRPTPKKPSAPPSSEEAEKPREPAPSTPASETRTSRPAGDTTRSVLVFDPSGQPRISRAPLRDQLAASRVRARTLERRLQDRGAPAPRETARPAPPRNRPTGRTARPQRRPRISLNRTTSRVRQRRQAAVLLRRGR